MRTNWNKAAAVRRQESKLWGSNGIKSEHKSANWTRPRSFGGAGKFATRVWQYHRRYGSERLSHHWIAANYRLKRQRAHEVTEFDQRHEEESDWIPKVGQNRDLRAQNAKLSSWEKNWRAECDEGGACPDVKHSKNREAKLWTALAEFWQINWANRKVWRTTRKIEQWNLKAYNGELDLKEDDDQ